MSPDIHSNGFLATSQRLWAEYAHILGVRNMYLVIASCSVGTEAMLRQYISGRIEEDFFKYIENRVLAGLSRSDSNS